MTPVLKKLILIDGDWKTFVPADLDCFCLYLQVAVGPQESEGYDLYHLRAVTADWLAQNTSDHETFLRSTLLLSEYNPKQIRDTITRLIEASRRPSWDATSDYLSRYMTSEFEDYDPDR